MSKKRKPPQETFVSISKPGVVQRVRCGGKAPPRKEEKYEEPTECTCAKHGCIDTPCKGMDCGCDWCHMLYMDFLSSR